MRLDDVLDEGEAEARPLSGARGIAAVETLEDEGKVLRRDAAENRQRLLDAAAAVFSERGLEAGVDEIALADTIGVGVPAQVRALTGMVREVAPGIPVRFHFHNTRNTGYANAAAALEEGVRVLDAAAGGFGGCPFSPAATGNIATEDLDFLAVRSGFHTGIKRDVIVSTAEWVGSLLERTPPALSGRAGVFPPIS